MIIACDLDGTLFEDKFPNIGRPNIDLINWLVGRKNHGDKLILWTVRENHDKRQLLDKAVQACAKLGLRFDAVNENVLPNEYAWQPRKIYAHIYIDDRAIAADRWPLCVDNLEKWQDKPLVETK